MPDSETSAAIELVPGRSCGDCNVCCVSLTINDPDLRKPQGYRCRNALPDNSCAIYETRPNTCRTFFCGWRLMKWVREPLRPDLSGVLVRQHRIVQRETGQVTPGIIITFLTNAGLKAEGLAETVAAAVAGGLAVFINVPGPPGFTSSQARIDDVLRHAVVTKDKAGVLDILRRARAKGKHGPKEPIQFKDMPRTDRTQHRAGPA